VQGEIRDPLDDIVEHATWSRAWLADLPPPLAERIAYRNADTLFPATTPARGQ